MNRKNKLIAVFLSFLMVLQGVTTVFSTVRMIGIALGTVSLSAELFAQPTTPQDYRDEGELTGGSLLGTVPLPEMNSSGDYVLQMPSGNQSMTPQQMFGPDSSGTPVVGDVGYGDNPQLNTITGDKAVLLTTSPTMDGEAFRQMNDLGSRTWPDLQNDPLWNTGDATLADLEAGTGTLFNPTCTTTTTTTDTTLTITETEMRTCRTLKRDKPDNCVVKRVVHDAIGWVGGSGTIGRCGDGCIEINAGVVGTNNLPANCGGSTTDHVYTAYITDANDIVTAVFSEIRWDDIIEITANGTTLFHSPGADIDSASCEIGAGGSRINLDVTATLKAVALANPTVEFRTRVRVGTTGHGYGVLQLQYADEDALFQPETIEMDPPGCIDDTGFRAPVYDLALTNIEMRISHWDTSGDNEHCTLIFRNPATGVELQTDGHFDDDGYADNPLDLKNNYPASCSELINYYITENRLGYLDDLAAMGYEINENSYGTGKPIDLLDAINDSLGNGYGWVNTDIEAFVVVDPGLDEPFQGNAYCQAYGGWVCDIRSAPLANSLDSKKIHGPLYPGDPNTAPCWQATAQNYACDPFGNQEVCIDGGPGTPICGEYYDMFDDVPCDELEDDPECGFISSTPDPDYLDPMTGISYSHISTYECATDYAIPGEETVEEETCIDALPCVAGECLTTANEVNNDFEKAVGQLGIANFLKHDNECIGGGGGVGCRVFNGVTASCRDGSALNVDCCDDPMGSGPADYIMGAYRMMKIADGMGAFEYIEAEAAASPTWSQMTGAWDDLADPAVDVATTVYDGAVSVYDSTVGEAWTATTDMFASAYDTVIGSLSNTTAGTSVSTAVDAAGEIVATVVDGTQEAMGTASNYGLDDIKQQLMRETYDALGQDLGNIFFDTVKEEAAQTAAEGAAEEAAGNTAVDEGAGTMAGELQLAGWLSTVMFAYMIYKLIVLAISIIYACEDEELVTANKIAQNLCYYTGTECDEKWLGKCVIDRHDYCCFTSPVARIIQAQGSVQLGFPAASCQGFTIPELGMIDWDLIDMTEWIDLLTLAGTIPTSADIDIADRTMDGVGINLENRIAQPERAQERLDQVNPDDIRQELKNDARGLP